MNTQNLSSELIQQRLHRQNPAAERNAREAQELAARFLGKLRKARKGPRVAALLAIVEPIVADGEAALKRHGSRIEILVAAEQWYRTARGTLDAANARFLMGSLDPAEALELARQLEIAQAAFRVRDRELSEAQKARAPLTGLPREALLAHEDTQRLVKEVLRSSIDVSGAPHRPANDVSGYARRAGKVTDPATAIWWIATELEALEAHEEATKDLTTLFDCRWDQYVKSQSLPEVARHREREEIAASPRGW